MPKEPKHALYDIYLNKHFIAKKIRLHNKHAKIKLFQKHIDEIEIK